MMKKGTSRSKRKKGIIEFEITGNIYTKNVSHDDMHDTFIDFVEEKGWLFGGGSREIKRGEYAFGGCVFQVGMLGYEKFCQEFDNFVKKQGWEFEGKIRKIKDGKYSKK